MDKSLCKSCTSETFITHERNNRQFVKLVQENEITNSGRIIHHAPTSEKVVPAKEKPAPPERVKIKFGKATIQITNSPIVQVREDGEFIELRLQKQ